MITIGKDQVTLTMGTLIPEWSLRSDAEQANHLICASGFVSLIYTGANWYRAQFGPAEHAAHDPLEAMTIAFLRDKGFEVTI